MANKYMFADLVHDYSVEGAAESFAEWGRQKAAKLANSMSADRYLDHDRASFDLSILLPAYQDAPNYYGFGEGIRRFFNLNFTRGWNEYVMRQEAI